MNEANKPGFPSMVTMGIRASSELRAAKEAGSLVGGSLRGRNPRGMETVKGGRVEMVEEGGRVVRKGKLSGVFMEPIASEDVRSMRQIFVSKRRLIPKKEREDRTSASTIYLVAGRFPAFPSIPWRAPTERGR